MRPADECDFHARIRRLKEAIDRGLFERKGPVIIPCFAIDRTQAVLFDLHQIYRADPGRYGQVPVLLSAPMAAQVNPIYGEAMKRKESIRVNVLKPVWRNKRLGEWLGIDESAQGERQLETFSTHKEKPNLAGRTIFVTHGEEEARRGLRSAIEAKLAEWSSRFADHPAVQVHLPRRLDHDRWFDLDRGVWLEPEATAPPVAADRPADLEARLAAAESRLAAAEAPRCDARADAECCAAPARTTFMIASGGQDLANADQPASSHRARAAP